MATAADYLQLSQTQVTSGYKLRTRVADQVILVATNVAPNYRLSVQVDSQLDGVVIDPQSFNLGPNESIQIGVTFSTQILETYPAGTLTDLINFTVSAQAIIVPDIPTPPPFPELPPAPKQITAKVEVYPNSYTFTEYNEVKDFAAKLFIDGVVIDDARFNWEFLENLADAFTQTNGSIKATKRGLNRGTLQAKVVYPPNLPADTIGLSAVATNIPLLAAESNTGTLSIKIRGLPNNTTGRVQISGLTSIISQDTVLEAIPVGTYTIIPEVISVNRSKFNPSGGGQIYLSPNTQQEIIITYTEQPIPDENSIVIVAVMDAGQNNLAPSSLINTGDRFAVSVQTYKNGEKANLGEVRVTATNTREGSVIATQFENGYSVAKFTVDQAGDISIMAMNEKTGSTPIGKLVSSGISRYSIKLITSKVALTGQCVAVNAVLLDNGVMTNIPVEIYANGAVVQPGPCTNTIQGGEIPVVASGGVPAGGGYGGTSEIAVM